MLNYEIKRLIEIFSSGLYSAEELLSSSSELFGRHRAIPYPDLMKMLIDCRPLGSEPAMADYCNEIKDKLSWRDTIREEAAPSNPAFRKWRERQIARCSFELGEAQNTAITHMPVVYELAVGCSVNCPFCALKAEPLTSLYRRTSENIALWRGILSVMRDPDLLGTASKWGSCYWATEPLDNPDQEAFYNDFYEINGMYPQTTTAVPLRDVERTRALLLDSYAKGCKVNRFSLHTGEQIIAVHANFSSEELANTELLLENPESGMIMARSGRMLELLHDNPELIHEEDIRVIASIEKKDSSLSGRLDGAFVNTSPLNINKGDRPQVNISGTTACISGFLVRLVQKSVELISPCSSDQEYPCGYIVHDRRTFENIDDFRAAILDMIKDNMPESVTPDDRVGLTSRVNFIPLSNGFELSTVFAKITYSHKIGGDFLAHLGNLLHEGNIQAGAIAIECFYSFGVDERTTLALINDIFSRGFLTR